MRICIINEFFYPDDTGGTGTVLSSLARTLSDNYASVSIDVITSNNLYRQSANHLPAQEDWNGISIYRLSTPKPNGVSTVKRLAANLHFTAVSLVKLLQLGKYDLVLVGTAPPMVAMAADIFKRLTKTPFVYVVYDLEPDRSVTMKVFAENNIFARAFRHYQKKWLHSAGKVVVLGRCMQEYLSRTYGLIQDQIAVIPIGQDADIIQPTSHNSSFRLNNNLQGFVVLYSGNFGRYHNFDTILDAARSLQESRTDVTIVLVGGGAQKSHIQQRIAAEKLGNVRMFDFVDKADYGDLLASANAGLVTLEQGMEGLCVPSKFYSILASGRPTLAMVAPNSEISYVLREAECGIQINQTDVQKLVDSIIYLAEHPDIVHEMGINARRVLVEKYSTEIIGQQYHAAFLDASANNYPPATGAVNRLNATFRYHPSRVIEQSQRVEPLEHEPAVH